MAYIRKTNIETRPRQPAALAKIKGTYQKCRHQDQVEESKALEFVYTTIPTPPQGLNEHGVQYWNSVLSEAAKIYGYVSYIDLKMFTQLCKIYGEMIELEKQMEGKPYLMKDANGRPIINPIYVLCNDIRDKFYKLSRDFGFTPSARTRIKLEQKPEQQKEVETFEL